MSVNLVKGCRLWDRITEKMNDGDYTIPEELRSEKLRGNSAYQPLDYNVLGCRITGKLAEVRVGDAEDHKTKINLGTKSLEYHDPDDPTNLGVADLLRSIGLKCNVFNFRGVTCRDVTAKNAVTVFKALAMIPSMDRRMEHCRNSHSASDCRKIEIAFFERTAKREKPITVRAKRVRMRRV